MRMGKWLAMVLVALLATAGGLSACATRDIPWPQLQAKYELPGSRYFETPDGLRVHYLDEGPRDAPAIVLVHGFAASVHAWRPWMERLSSDYRVIALDLPGHGLTANPRGYRASLDGNVALIDQLIRHLGVERFVLGGNSMGGAVSWNYALAHPQRLNGLVLVCAAGWPASGRGGDGPPVVFQLLNNPVGRAILKVFDPRDIARGGLEAAYVDEALVDDALVNRYGELALAPGHRDVLLTMRSRGARAATPQDFAAIKTPTLVMSGDLDEIIPPDQSRAFADAIPGAQLIRYADGGHVPMEQLPDRSAADLRAFLQGLNLRPAPQG
jgi:pimeloyl-ACP methyl ester carboxylesterase